HPDSALAEPPGGNRLRDLLARQRLGVRRHRILEVEDDPVGRENAGFFQRPGIRSGHEKQAAARMDHGLGSLMARSGWANTGFAKPGSDPVGTGQALGIRTSRDNIRDHPQEDLFDRKAYG